MSDWLMGFIAAGIWFGVFYLEKISKSSEEIRKAVAGIRYQSEQAEKRLNDISVRLYGLENAIKRPAESPSNWWNDTFKGEDG